MDLTDKEEVIRVVKGCSNGDEKFQQMLYKHMYSKMMGVCYRYTDRPEDAQDLFQEGFIKVFNKIDKFNFKGSLEGWIRRIMVNHSIDYYRKNKNKFAISETLIVAEQIPSEEIKEGIFDDIEANDLMLQIQKLSPAYRTVFNLYILDGYSHSEIAEELGISEGTSKSNLSKAKRNLKELVLQYLKNERK